jgi:hypothetical protein
MAQFKGKKKFVHLNFLLMGIFSYLVDLIFCYTGICYSEIFLSVTVAGTLFIG